MCTAIRNGTDRQLRATSLHVSTRYRFPPNCRRVCSDVQLQQFTAPSELHASSTTTTSSSTAWQVGTLPHRLTLKLPALYASLPSPEAATLQHSPLLRVQSARLCYNFALLRGLTQHLLTTGLPPDESALALSFNSQRRLSKSTLLPHYDHNNAIH